MESPPNPDRLTSLASQDRLVDYLVKKAHSEGAFDNLPGAGKPIPDLEEPYDELWWAKKLLEREGLKDLFKQDRDTQANS